MRCKAAINAPNSFCFMYCISSTKKQIGISLLYAVSPIVVNTSVKLCVKLFDIYSSFSCKETENVLSLGLNEITRDLIASNGFCTKCLNLSFVLTLRKNACEHSASCEIKSFRSSTSICLQNISLSSAIVCNLLIRTVFPTPRNPLKIRDCIGIFSFNASNISSTLLMSSSLPAIYIGINPAPGLYGFIFTISITSS